MLTADELACIAETVTASLTDTCSIYQRSTVSDGAGGHTIAYTLRAADVPCIVAAASTNAQQQERIISAVLQGRSGYYVTLPAGTVVSIQDRIVHAVGTLEVALNPGAVTNEVARRVICVWLESDQDA